MDGSTTLGTAKLDATGTANLAVSSLAAGFHSLMANYSGDALVTSGSGGPIAVSVTDFTLQAQPPSILVSRGQSGTTTVSVLPLGGSTQTVSFTCAAQSAELTCSFSPSSVTLDGTNPGNVKVTVNTRLTTALATMKNGAAGVLSAVAFAGLFLPWRRRKWQGLLAMAFMIGVAFYSAGCGSGSSNTTVRPGIYVVNISASSGNGAAAKVTPIVVTVTN